MEQIINKISQKELGSVPDSIEAIIDKGKTNQVYKVLVEGTYYIFRLNNRDYLKTYEKEKFCIDKIQNLNIPSSICYGTGIENDNSYIILNYIEGMNGLDLKDEEEQKRIWTKLGEFTSKFSEIEVEGCGMEVEDSNKGFFESWNKFLDSKLDNLFGSNFFVDKNVLTEEQSINLKNRLEEMYKWEFTPRLNHGNLNTSNAVVSPDGTVYLIDWGNGSGYRASYADLADIIAWKEGQKYLDYFLEGYGMSKEDFNEIEHEVNNVLIIQFMDLIKKGIENNYEHLSNKEFIEKTVKRIMEMK